LLILNYSLLDSAVVIPYRHFPGALIAHTAHGLSAFYGCNPQTGGFCEGSNHLIAPRGLCPVQIIVHSFQPAFRGLTGMIASDTKTDRNRPIRQQPGFHDFAADLFSDLFPVIVVAVVKQT
jgi:hypothetical protein